MNLTTGRGVIAETIPCGWAFVFCLLTLMAAMVFVVPQAFAARGGIPGKPADVGPNAPKVAGPFSTVSGTVTQSRAPEHRTNMAYTPKIHLRLVGEGG
jgi:hypothetical protein